MKCPTCQGECRKTQEPECFTYWGLPIRTVIPVYHCINKKCGLEFTDSEAERIRERAIENAKADAKGLSG